MLIDNELKYILVDKLIAGELVGDRVFQSLDFPHGEALAALILGRNAEIPSNKKISPIYIKNGLFFVSPNGKYQDQDLFVLDLQEASLFVGRTDSDCLFLFQKMIRFAIKLWERMGLTYAERVLPNSTKGILFPYPYSAQNPFRIAFELAPDKRKREKRTKGQEILVYKCGTDEGGGISEEASTTNFRKAIDNLADAYSQIKELARPEKEGNGIPAVLSVTRLDSSEKLLSVGEATFDEWLPLLTNAQKELIETELHSPHRIEGPAGTGKTLSLILKCIATLRNAYKDSKPHRALFIAHSDATRRSIYNLFRPELDKGLISEDDNMASQSVKITTLQSYCAEILNTEISETEFLDRDAFESKQAQLLYTLEAFEETMLSDFSTHRVFMSPVFADFLEKEDHWLIADMLQHEISVKIKGRADEDEAKYKQLPKIKYGIPVDNDGDKIFIFLIFKNYKKRLEKAGQFDTDDIVISALSQLNTPIWRRRRVKGGFDSIYIDETHLFNLNELSTFHKLTRSEAKFPIVYSADISQSLSDRGWDSETFGLAMGLTSEEQRSDKPTVFKSIFRCSPDIVSLAFSVTASGATLFTNFEDPMKAANSMFTYDEEKKCRVPIYWEVRSDEVMFQKAFSRAEFLMNDLGCAKADIAIVVFGDLLFSEFEKMARINNKPIEIIKHRGDYDVVRRARQGGRFVLTTAEYVGGLEFSAVVLIGVDKDRVPPHPSSQPDSLNFLSYASHQKLYVAITRARFRVEIIGLKTRGSSTLLTMAIEKNLIRKEDLN